MVFGVILGVFQVFPGVSSHGFFPGVSTCIFTWGFSRCFRVYLHMGFFQVFPRVSSHWFFPGVSGCLLFIWCFFLPVIFHIKVFWRQDGKKRALRIEIVESTCEFNLKSGALYES